MSVTGGRELNRELNNLPDNVIRVINAVVSANADEVSDRAKSIVVYDKGNLRRSIKAIEVNPTTYKVVANATGLAPYAAYVEFGTGGSVEVPEDLREVAARFIGRGRKRINLPARPYLYPALLMQRQTFLRDLVNNLERLIDRI